ncbi:transposase [Corallococcus sp. bb12-1]|uniref:IS66 family transposase n=1 Tax=Corallococcus sp. bb12-1 TaxID=2996784 RepID=UPI0022702654|nr:transposase [Corallococcus sp. bb12-1]MCY1046704.1 transposase [Corallococcus sp. bb12-1]
MPEVRQYELHAGWCADCSAWRCAPLPAGVPEGNFGPRLTGFIALCTGRFRLSKRLVADGPAPATLAFCWAHVRRKFFEAKQFAPACEEVLKLIGELYAIEADLPGWYALAQRLAVRQQHSAPVVERIRQWALAPRAAPGSAFRKALESMLKLWDGLTVFLRTPEVPLDNNHVERQMRDRVVGRKNRQAPQEPELTLAPAARPGRVNAAPGRGTAN